MKNSKTRDKKVEKGEAVRKIAWRCGVNALVIVLVAAVLAGARMLPVCAADECGENCVKTAILGTDHCVCDDKGSSILYILNLAVDILTMGVGILGVIGITWVGIQYLTAAGNEEQARKAKKRMSQIVVGLIVYALIYAIARWLMPSVS